METINAAFFFVTDKIISLQAFFIGQALAIGQLVLLISILAATLNYALTGQRLKENIIKITKALVFFFIVIFAYPQIISFITHWTFDRAHASTFGRIESSVLDQRTMMADSVTDAQGQGTYSQQMMDALDNPMDFFGGDILRTRRFANITYTVVAPAAAMGAVLQVAGNIFRWGEREASFGLGTGRPNIATGILGFLLALVVVFIGVFAILEYLMAYLEFLLVSSVGVILFPLSIWEGSRFLSEKFIGAIIGFFIKLLFCNITLFLMLWGFTSLALSHHTHPFTGTIGEIAVVIFICLMFFYICKSAPGIAQGLLNGVPSLSATGAISAVTGAVASVAAAGGIASKAASGTASLAAKHAFGGAGMLAQATSAATSAKSLGGTAGDMAKVFMGSVGSSLKEAGLARGGNLTRSLLASGGSSGGGGGGGTGAGINRHDNRQKFLDKPTENGEKQTFREYLQSRKNQGADRGLNYMAKKEAASASSTPESKDPDYKAAMSELNKEFPGSGKRA